HAGLGFYDLQHANAQITHEYNDGAAQFLENKVADEFKAYSEIVKSYTSQHLYPGSAAIMQHYLRENDRLMLNELHPEDFQVLRDNFSSDRRVKIFNQNGFQCLKALLPPSERRGLIFIDPAFEVKDEFFLIIDGMKDALKRFATGIYLIWYPIKDRKPVEHFYRQLGELSSPMMYVELHANT